MMDTNQQWQRVVVQSHGVGWHQVNLTKPSLMLLMEPSTTILQFPKYSRSRVLIKKQKLSLQVKLGLVKWANLASVTCLIIGNLYHQGGKDQLAILGLQVLTCRYSLSIQLAWYRQQVFSLLSQACKYLLATWDLQVLTCQYREQVFSLPWLEM